MGGREKRVVFMGKGIFRGFIFRWAAVIGATLFLFMIMPSAGAEVKQSFQHWLSDLRREARSLGISEEVLNEALGDVRLIPRVIKLDRSQPEATLTLQTYLRRVLPESVVADGREKLEQNRDLLRAIEQSYGVQARFIVALWGIETKFGRFTGGYSVIDALATLSYDGRRGKLFRKELLSALRILEEGHITMDKMKGSWAGAMGQVQFMPSSFIHYAVDYDRDGRIDIWNSLGDIFASTANYLSRAGWKGDQTWGRRVQLPHPLEWGLVGLDSQKRLSDWQRLGVRRADGRDLPKSPDLMASIVMPDGEDGTAFVVYHNYRVLLKWNMSQFFGVAVGSLADLIGSY
jgi:membrane-bound lytic murein transglycosylase B